jgi:hypothetical protein
VLDLERGLSSSVFTALDAGKSPASLSEMGAAADA